MTLPCKICKSPAAPYFTCDFHENANASFGFWKASIAPSGKMVPYFCCGNCGFLFTDFFDGWTKEMFEKRIYNKDYTRLDDGYCGGRAGVMANNLISAIPRLKELSVLDYGGGSGIQNMILEKFGCKRTLSYDPFASDKVLYGAPYDIVTCSEVLEHSITPRATIQDMLSFLKDDGIALVTTLLQPPDIAEQRAAWWYCAPRCGHASFYTKDVLEKLYEGYSIIFAGEGLHFVFKRWPSWADKMFPPGMEPR